MLLGDLGAEVLRIERAGGNGWSNPVVDRGRATLTLDIRTQQGRDAALDTLSVADVLLEGFRPGVMERLGLGPDIVSARNERLIYGRMTGWGQEGPLARSAGHDITYLALSGALAAIGVPGRPAVPPLNLVGDFGGGSMFLAFGIMAALWERERSGRGQVVDAAIVDGVASMMTMFSGLLPSGRISLDRRENILGGAAPYYRCYRCADGGEIAVGALEPQFWRTLVDLLGKPHLTQDRADWEAVAGELEALFASRPLQDWRNLLEGSDACATAVLDLEAVADDPHHLERGTYVKHNGLAQAAPAPRFSRTPGMIQDSSTPDEMLSRWQATAGGRRETSGRATEK